MAENKGGLLYEKEAEIRAGIAYTEGYNRAVECLSTERRKVVEEIFEGTLKRVKKHWRRYRDFKDKASCLVTLEAIYDEISDFKAHFLKE